jgi:VanZ family protein
MLILRSGNFAYPVRYFHHERESAGGDGQLLGQEGVWAGFDIISHGPPGGQVQTRKHKLITRLVLPLSVAALFLLVLIVILADTSSMPAFLFAIYNMPNGDKIGHVILMGLLGFALNMILFARKVRYFSFHLLLGTVVAVVLVTIEEISQVFFPSRRFSLVDLGSSYLGILFADILLRIILRAQH